MKWWLVIITALALAGCGTFPQAANPPPYTTDTQAELDVALVGQTAEAIEQSIRDAAPGIVGQTMEVFERLAKESGLLVAPVARTRDEQGQQVHDEEGNPLWEYGQTSGIAATLAMFAYAWMRGRKQETRIAQVEGRTEVPTKA